MCATDTPEIFMLTEQPMHIVRIVRNSFANSSLLFTFSLEGMPSIVCGSFFSANKAVNEELQKVGKRRGRQFLSQVDFHQIVIV